MIIVKERKLQKMKNYYDMRVFGNRYFNGKVEITDPCYDKDSWCRLTTDIKPGNYYLLYFEKDEGDWGTRVAQIAILNSDEEMDSFDIDNLVEFCIGEIGVDAGLAGFFENKPDYDDDAWVEFCNNLRNKDADADVWQIDCGYFSESGYGDGGYLVFGYKNDKNEVVGLCIYFIDDMYEKDADEDYDEDDENE